MNKTGTTVGFAALAIIVVVGLFFLGALLLQALVNVVLNQYDAEPLAYGSALAVTLLLSVFGGAVRGNSDK